MNYLTTSAFTLKGKVREQHRKRFNKTPLERGFRGVSEQKKYNHVSQTQRIRKSAKAHR